MSKYSNLKAMVIELREQIKRQFDETDDPAKLRKLSTALDLAISAETILECAEEKDRGRSLAKLFADRITLTADTLTQEELANGPAGEMLKAVCDIMDEIEKETIERQLRDQQKKIKIPTLDSYAKEAKKIY